jgi:hypothetical protein
MKEYARVLFTDINQLQVRKVVHKLDSSQAKNSKLGVPKAIDFKKTIESVTGRWFTSVLFAPWGRFTISFGWKLYLFKGIP